MSASRGAVPSVSVTRVTKSGFCFSNENSRALRSVLIEVSRHGKSEAIERFDVCAPCQERFADTLDEFTQSRIDSSQFRREGGEAS